MAAPVSSAPLESWRPFLTGHPYRDLLRLLQASPKLAALVKPSFPGQPALTAALDEDSSGATIDCGRVCVEVVVRWTCPDGSVFGSASFDLGGLEPTCRWHGLDLEWDYRQRGSGTQYRIALVEVCRDLGLESVLIDATMVGRYTWARAGFEFLDQDERRRVIDEAKGFARRMGAEVPIDLDSVEHPSEIANLAGEIDLEKLARLRHDKLTRLPQGPMTLGMALLLGPANNSWLGELDLTR